MGPVATGRWHPCPATSGDAWSSAFGPWSSPKPSTSALLVALEQSHEPHSEESTHRKLVSCPCGRLAHGGQAAPPGAVRVKVAHASAAVEETFDSLHMTLMCMAPRLEKLLLAALLLEVRFTGEWSQQDATPLLTTALGNLAAHHDCRWHAHAAAGGVR